MTDKIVCPNCGHDQFDEDGDCLRCFEPAVQARPKSISVVDAALALARRGFAVFPLKHKSKNPATKHGCKDASTDPDQIRKLFGKKRSPNIGIATGEPSGIWVLDLDGQEGISTFVYLADKRGGVPTTVSVRTGGGGEQHYFKLNGEPIRNRQKVDGEPIDVRGEGGYVVAVPSVHPDTGKTYAWINDPDSTPIVEAPEWLVAWVITDQQPVRDGLEFTIGEDLDLDADLGATKGERHTRLLTLLGAEVARDRDLAEIWDQANKWAARCEPKLDESEVKRLLDYVVRQKRSPAREAKLASTPKLDPPLPWRPFPVNALAEPIRTYVLRSSEAIGCDPAYVVTAILPALTGAVGNTRQIIIKRGWVEPPVLWGGIIGDSGSLKSPAIDAAVRHIRSRQAKAVEVHRDQLEVFEQELADHKILYDDWKRSGRKRGEPPPEEPQKPICERFTCSDVTVEGLAVLLSDAPRGLLLIRDELSGWLGSFDQYKQGHGADLAHWLTIHGARDLLVDRKTGDRKTIYVPRAAVSIIGGVQPGTLARALGREHFEDGLAARLLLCMPPRRPKRWTEIEVDERLDDEIARLFDRLLGLQASEDGAPLTVGITEAGKRAWVEFYSEHAERQVDAEGKHAAVLSKLEGGAARLALIDHLVRDQGTAVDETSILAGVTIARWYADEAERVYQALGETDGQRQLREVADLVRRRGGRATPNDLRKWTRHVQTNEDAERLLGNLVDADLGRWENRPTTSAGGRPTRVFVLSETVTVTKTPETLDENRVLVTGTPQGSGNRGPASMEVTRI